MVDVESILGSALVSAVISAVVAWFSGDRWVEMSRRRRDHSLQLRNESFGYWYENIGDFFVKGVEYDHEMGVFKGLEPKTMADLPYPHFLQSHIKSGYPELLVLWKSLRDEVKRYNEKRSLIYEVLKEDIEVVARRLGLSIHYYRWGHSMSFINIRPKNVIDSIIQELENRLKGMDEWLQGKPGIGPITSGDVKAHYLHWMGMQLMTDEDRSKIEAVQEVVVSWVQDSELNVIIKDLVEAEAVHEKDKSAFKDELLKRMEYIDMGHNIKGKCDACRSQLHL